MSDGPLPVGWTSRFLGECLEKLKSGKRVERGWSPQCLNHPVQNEEEWGVLKTTAVQMGEYQPEHNKTLPSSAEPKRGLVVEDGDFLLTTTGPRSRCGVVCLARRTPRNLIFSGKILRFRANQSIAFSSWLHFALMSPVIQETLNGLKVGTSDSSVSIGNQQVLDLQMSVPPIAEQEKIVEILEEQLARLDAVVKSVQTVREKAAQFRRSLLHDCFRGRRASPGGTIEQEMAEWQEAPVGDLATISYGYTESACWEEVGPKFLRITDIQDGAVNWEQVPFCTIEPEKEAAHLLCSGDIVFARTGATTGKSYLLKAPPRAVCASYLIRLRPAVSKVSPEYLQYFFQSDEYWQQVFSETTGTAQGGVNASKLSKLRVPFCSMANQSDIVALLDDEMSKVGVAVEAVDRVERTALALRRSLLHAAFSGELTRSWREANV